MTSQVSLINHAGIALASDTFTTLGGSKTLGNSSKIYELGPGHTMVLLHSGNVNINGVSSWLHATEWSRSLGKPLQTIDHYVNSFIEWFNSPRAIYSKESADELAEAAVADVLEWISDQVAESVRSFVFDSEAGTTYEVQVQKVASTAIAAAISRVESWTNFDGYSDVSAKETLDAMPNVDVSGLITLHFSQFNLSSADLKRLKKVAPLGLSRRSYLATDSDLVFAGFGSDEPFGSVVKLTVRGAYAGKLRCHISGRDTVQAYHPVSSLYAFAQDDAIQGFVRGITFKVRNEINNRTLATSRAVIEREFPLLETSEVEKVSREIQSQISDQIEAFSLQGFAHPLMDTVSSMSLHGLAELAESLIGIQAASTYSKSGAATVGGEVEVVTINRLHGVEWRKRLS